MRFKAFVDLMGELRKLNNFNSVAAVAAGLNSGVLKRCASLTTDVPQSVIDALEVRSDDQQA